MRRKITACVAACLLLHAATGAAQRRIDTGIGVGTLQVGTGPGAFAISPHVGIDWRSGVWSIGAHYTALLIPERSGMGHTHQLLLGGGGELFQTGARVMLGGSATAYRIVACGVEVCGPVLGIAVGAHARIDYSIKGPLGLSASGGVDWFGGRSAALPGGLAVTITVGPSVTFGERR